MSRTGITQEQVFATAQALADADHPVTLQAVRDALGAGSFSTISQHLRQWREEVRRRVPAPPWPSDVDAVATKAAATIWAVANEHARRELDALQQASQAQINAAQSQTQEALHEVVRLEGQLDHANQQSAEHARQSEILRTAASATEVVLAAQHATLDQLTARVAELKSDVERAHTATAQKAEECGRLQGELAASAKRGRATSAI